MQQQPFVVAYVQPSVKVSRPYGGARIRRGRIKIYRGGKPVRNQDAILAMVGRKV
jgi:hypothetical protein